MRFRVVGTPAPQGSKRHVGGGRMVEMSRAVGPWREAVRTEAQQAGSVHCAVYHGGERCPDERPFLGAVSVMVVFVVSRPKTHYRTGHNAHLLRDSAPPFPAGRPDVDKLARAVLDGLVMGGVMADDSQVVTLVARKTYAENGESPGAVIEVEAMQ